MDSELVKETLEALGSPLYGLAFKKSKAITLDQNEVQIIEAQPGNWTITDKDGACCGRNLRSLLLLRM